MNKKQGDTLIEVTLAIGIFSLVAIGVVSVVSQSTSRSQVALEETLAREEIDAQAEALRFIQSSYASSKNMSVDEESTSRSLWQEVTAQVNKKEQITDNLLKFQPSTCAELYDGETLENQKAFIINTRKLSSANSDEIVVRANDSELFFETQTYPRLRYGLLADSDPLLEENSISSDALQGADGIYIIGVQDPETTNVVSIKNGSSKINKVSAYYDFYIRACWYAVGAERPTTISTVIRLHNPDAIEVVEPTNPDPPVDPDPIVCSPTILELKQMQDFARLTSTEKTCVTDSMEPNTVYNLIDNRDNHSYAIAKLKDGNIWMTENLDLGRTALTTNLTSSNTNLSTTIPAATFNSWKKDIGTSTYTAGEFISVAGTDSIAGTAHGTLYNYYATSGGTISGAASSRNATYDICPAGWRLPTGGSSGELKTLSDKYNAPSMLLRAPVVSGGVGFTMSGTFRYELAISGDRGHYWSSTLGRSDKTMYMMSVFDKGDITTNFTSRFYGLSVRCLVRR